MVRKFTEHSYQYIQGWLKDKYKNDPIHREKMKQTSYVCIIRKRIQNKTNILMLHTLSELYQSKTFV
jgi:hypothetical protein